MKFIYTETYELGTWEELKEKLEKLKKLDSEICERIPNDKEEMENFLFDLIEYGCDVYDFAQDLEVEGRLVED